MMTMHKAKGLSAKIVFIPFLREDLKMKDSKLWMRPSCGDLKGTPYLVSPSSLFMNTWFIDDYRKASLHSAIDTFNLAYVAFTRAKEKMYIYMPAESPALRLSKYLQLYIDSRLSVSDSGMELIKEEEDVIVRACKKSKDGVKETDIHLLRYNLGIEDGCAAAKQESGKADKIDLSEYRHNTTVRGVLRSVTFGKEDDIRHKGIILHEAYSLLGSPGRQNLDRQILEAAEKLVRRNPSYRILGESAEAISAMMKEQIDSVKEYDWFSDEYESINESEILYGGEFWRPDRVLVRPASKDEATVVDYKFGITEDGKRFNALKSKYEKQVRWYVELLKKMGYKSVRGYLWFVMSGTVVEV